MSGVRLAIDDGGTGPCSVCVGKSAVRPMKHSRTADGMHRLLFPVDQKSLSLKSESLSLSHTLTASIQIFDCIRVFVNQYARHEDARITKTIDHKFQRPAVFDAMLLNQLCQTEIQLIVIVPGQM